MTEKANNVLAITPPTIPGAMIQFPVLIPGIPAPPPIPALPGMEKIPPPPGITVVDAEGKVIAKGPELPKPPAAPAGLPTPPTVPIPEVVPTEKLGEEEIEELISREAKKVLGRTLEPIETGEEEMFEVEEGIAEGDQISLLDGSEFEL
jgi:hypothetical protein